MADQREIYILWYEYFDKSGTKVLKAFNDEEIATEIWELLKESSTDKEYHLTPVELFER